MKEAEAEAGLDGGRHGTKEEKNQSEGRAEARLRGQVASCSLIPSLLTPLAQNPLS